jgi:ATP/maltotriose-dependent transcriptional regulator MalT
LICSASSGKASVRARGELAEIRAAELRFTADEAAAYLGFPRQP